MSSCLLFLSRLIYIVGEEGDVNLLSFPATCHTLSMTLTDAMVMLLKGYLAHYLEVVTVDYYSLSSGCSNWPLYMTIYKAKTLLKEQALTGKGGEAKGQWEMIFMSSHLISLIY